MFDTDGNQRVDKNEFLVVSNHFQLSTNCQFVSSFYAILELINNNKNKKLEQF